MWSTVWMLTQPHVGKWKQTLRAAFFIVGAFAAAWFGVTPIPIIIGALLLGYFWPVQESKAEAK
jgi:hypothetical protein